jgi:hypothetical protein
MATIDCTLAAFKVPGFQNYTPAFGTKKEEGVSLTPREANTNIMMPFSRQRPFVISEDSATSAIETDAVFDINTAGVTLTLGAAFTGCFIRVINSSDDDVTVIYGDEKEQVIGSGKSVHLEYIGEWDIAASGGGDAGSGNGGVYGNYASLPVTGKAGEFYFVIADDLTYQWNVIKQRYETHFANFAALPVSGIANRNYITDDSELLYTWIDIMYAEHYTTLGNFPSTGVTDRYYFEDSTDRLYEWGEMYGKYMIRFPNFAAFPVQGVSNIIYIASDTDIRYYWDSTHSSYLPNEGGSGTLGAIDTTTISEENLLTVLGVATVAEAIEELHVRLNNDGQTGNSYLSDLKIGMYLDLPSLNDGSTTISHNATYQNLRIRIADYNKYKNSNNPLNHIVWEFKHIPISKQMRTGNTNTGGYPSTDSTCVYKPYVEGGFLTGLKAALGMDNDHNYMYAVKRNVTTGSNGAWTKSQLQAAIFPAAEKEVFGSNPYGNSTTESDLSQLAIYAAGASKVKNLNGSATTWWEGSPYASGTTIFCNVTSSGGANNGHSSSSYGVSPCFCMS